MRKLFIFLGVIFFLFPFVEGQEKPVLKFNSNSKFKIVQFTDIHLQYDSYRSDSSLAMMKAIIESEKPDLVMLTGDIVGSDNRKKAWEKVAQVMIDAKVAWAAMLGNHDAEYELDKEQTMNVIANLPYSLTVSGPKEVSGAGNYVLPIQSAKSNKTVALCYVLDVSQTKSPPRNGDNSGVFEWIDESQVRWYKEQSAAFTKQNGGKPFPALAFFHIPLPEYQEVAGKSTTLGSLSERVSFSREEGAASSREGRASASRNYKSNLYTAMLECKDVMGTFAGHVHNSDYIGCLNDICLAYGQSTGRQISGDNGCGARIIELYEGQRKFDSWILKLYNYSRDADIWTPTYSKERMFFASYPDSFDEKKLSSDKVKMTTEAGGEVNMQLCGSGVATVDWGDGSKKDVLTLNKDKSARIYHTYPGAAIRTITVNGDNITALDCNRCGLTSLDVSKNTELTSLTCSFNQLTRLNVSKNTALTSLVCDHNRHLANLDVSKNTALTLLECGDNQLASLDVSYNTALKVLWCNGNRLTGLDVSKNTALKELYCYENQLTGLDVSKNTALTWLNCYRNQLTSLDLSKNTVLRRLDCYENRITSLGLNNNSVALNWLVCTDNQLTAAALNVLFGSVHGSANPGKIYISGNPGEKDCDRSLVSKGWVVTERY